MPERVRGFLAVVAAGLLLTGCVPSEQPAALSAGNDFQAALRSRDGRAACDLLALAARSRLESGQGRPCPVALEALALPGDAGSAVEVWGDNAQLRLPSGVVFLARFRTGWKVTAAGCRPRPDMPYDCDVEG